MFEQLVRPFTSRQITTTRRVIPVKVDDKPATATITWGTAGEMPQNVVQPKATNLENIESVGFNIRGSIDRWNQSVRESDRVEIPVRDNAGNQVGTTTVDRVKSITFTGRPSLNDVLNSTSMAYLPNYTGVATLPDQQQTYTPISSGKSAPSGLRQNVPSADTTQSIYEYKYPNSEAA